MSRLTVYRDDAPQAPILTTEDASRIAETLEPIGVRFERWESPVKLSPDDSPETILEAYKPYLDGLMGETGAGSADVLKLTPDNPNALTLRQKIPVRAHAFRGRGAVLRPWSGQFYHARQWAGL